MLGWILQNIHNYIKHKSKTATVVKLWFIGFYQKSLQSRSRNKSRKVEIAQLYVYETKMSTKTRGDNWTALENQTLVQEYQARKDIIDGKVRSNSPVKYHYFHSFFTDSVSFRQNWLQMTKKKHSKK